MNQDCLFCKIIRGEIPGTKVYEDEKTLAFLDIKPVNPGHVLVVPKEHAETFLDVSSEALTSLVSAMQKVAAAVKRAMNVEGFNLEQNNGPVAGQVVPHLHFHIVPRLADDGLKHWPGTPYQDQSEADAVAEKIRHELA